VEPIIGEGGKDFTGKIVFADQFEAKALHRHDHVHVGGNYWSTRITRQNAGSRTAANIDMSDLYD